MDSHTVIRLHSVSTARPSLSLHILPAILSHANHVFLVVSRVSGWPNIVPVLCTPITWLTKTSLTPTFARIVTGMFATLASGYTSIVDSHWPCLSRYLLLGSARLSGVIIRSVWKSREPVTRHGRPSASLSKPFHAVSELCLGSSEITSPRRCSVWADS